MLRQKAPEESSIDYILHGIDTIFNIPNMISPDILIGYMVKVDGKTYRFHHQDGQRAYDIAEKSHGSCMPVYAGQILEAHTNLKLSKQKKKNVKTA